MRIKSLIALVVALATVIVLAGGASALAAANHPKSGKFLNARDVPDGSKLILNITYKVTNDEDSGNVGYWALDDYNKHVRVWRVPDGTFYVVAEYEGKWNTLAGALSPGAGAVQSADAKGTFKGGYTATFAADSYVPTFGHVGSYDFGGTKADVILGTYGAGQTGAPAPFDFLTQYFTGATSFTYVNWGWTYKYKNQRWDNFDSGTTGDIVI